LELNDYLEFILYLFNNDFSLLFNLLLPDYLLLISLYSY